MRPWNTSGSGGGLGADPGVEEVLSSGGGGAVEAALGSSGGFSAPSKSLAPCLWWDWGRRERSWAGPISQ